MLYVHIFHATLGLDVSPYEVPPHIPEHRPPRMKPSIPTSSCTHSKSSPLPPHPAPATPPLQIESKIKKCNKNN